MKLLPFTPQLGRLPHGANTGETPVGIDPDFPPFEAVDVIGRHWGMAADHLTILEEKLGITFEIGHLFTSSQLQRMADLRY